MNYRTLGQTIALNYIAGNEASISMALRSAHDLNEKGREKDGSDIIRGWFDVTTSSR